jgi:glycosyltransferase involved in cell wall biosynthesis
MVIQEAFAAGTPVVASYSGGIPEAVDPSWGTLFIPGSLPDLQQCIKSVLLKENWEGLNRKVKTQWERKFNLSDTVAYIESVILEGLQ